MKHPRNWPMVARVFALIVATVLATQLVNALLLTAMPQPPARLQSVKRLTAVLRGAAPQGGEVVEQWRGRLPPGPRDERDLVLVTRLAAALEVPRETVRAQVDGQPGAIGRAYESTNRPELDDDVVIGPAIASLQQPDGSWRSVRPPGSWYHAWRLRLFGWMLIATCTVCLPAWLLARRLAMPFRTFSEAAERIGRDPRAPPLPLSGPPELAQAVEAVNEMQRLVHRYVEDRMEVIGAIAHDMRTPLMRIAMRLEHAPPQQRLAAEADMRELQERLTATMRFVRGLSAQIVRRRLDLRSAVESVVADAADSGAAVTLKAGEPIVVLGDGPALKAAVANLVENAVRYAGAATVEIAEAGAAVIVSVRDRGPGMTPDDLKRAFEPFFRGEASRNRETGGIGLGLASVRAIARAHGGEATLEGAATGGLMARLIVPRG